MTLNALIYFIKAPIEGRVKTRLAKRIGNQKALEVYNHFVQHLLDLSLPSLSDRLIAYDTPNRALPLPLYLAKETFFYQEGEDLGERMAHAFEYAFAKGYKKVILIRSDVPDIKVRILDEAFNALSHNDAIISPTVDGSYYLIGFNAHTFTKDAFENIPLETSEVYTQTKMQLKNHLVAEGKKLHSIHTLEDLKAYMPTFPLKRISVIIPVYYEDKTLLHTIQSLYQHASSDDFEVIIVDTHEKTTINTLDLRGVRIGFSEQGRAYQMNEGALMAQGEILLFLRADAHVPKQWDKLIERKDAGAFGLGIDTSLFWLKCIEFFANLRARVTRIPYGDQGLFLKASIFDDLGGFAPIPIMEDVELMKRLKRHKIALNLLDEKVFISDRQWKQEGIFYTTWRNRLVNFLYMCGVAPSKLQKYYKPRPS